MKIICNRPYEDWVVDAMTQDYINNSRHEVIDKIIDKSELESCDLFWWFGTTAVGGLQEKDSTYYLNLAKEKKVVRTIHHFVPWKFDESKYQNFMSADQFVDCYHTYTENTAANISSLSQKPVKIIPHLVNKKKWYPLDKDECRKDLNTIAKNKKKSKFTDADRLERSNFVIGSFQRDTEAPDQTAPKLEKGPDLFVDICKRFYNLKSNVKILLGGCRREYVINELSKAGIPYVYFLNASQETVNKMYNACDLYVVSSRIEGGPQAIFEASATKTKIISTNCGQAVNILDKECITLLNDNDEQYRLLDIDSLDVPSDNSVINNFENIEKYSIENSIKVYDDFFEEIL
jgi:glycosyltransferase involved in cell wall biosynthesis